LPEQAFNISVSDELYQIKTDLRKAAAENSNFSQRKMAAGIGAINS
jgi:hypothetical protein